MGCKYFYEGLFAIFIRFYKTINNCSQKVLTRWKNTVYLSSLIKSADANLFNPSEASMLQLGA